MEHDAIKHSVTPSFEGEFDVIIVGLGPCGATLANHLGLYGIRTLAIDRSTAILDYPRAVGMDDEALRSFQTVGLADSLQQDMLRNTSARYYTAKGKCFAKVQPDTQPFGWPRRNLFIQPLAEATIREGLTRFDTVETRFGFALQGLVDNGNRGVEVSGVRADGSSWNARCRYLVGADGGRSIVRDQIGVKLEGETDAARWLVIDVSNDHLDWRSSCVFTDRRHPRMTIELPHGYRRFEFRLAQDESDDDAVLPDSIERRLAMFYDGDRQAELVRARVYRHHSRLADRFRVGNVLLAGDAAHLQPPFFGQGMNSGLRDATNLAWKLALASRTGNSDGVLDTYEQERREHARQMVDMATRIGRLYSPHTRLGEIARDFFFAFSNKIPALRSYITQMKFKPMPFYKDGFVHHIKSPGPVGKMFIQPQVRMEDGAVVKLDDAIGPWFAIIAFSANPREAVSEEVAERWKGIGARFIDIRPDFKQHHDDNGLISVVEDFTNAFSVWLEANPLVRFLILRPDRYVAAACSLDYADVAARKIFNLIHDR